MKIAGIILSGGKSIRMGQNKALLSYKNARLIDFVAKILHDAGIGTIFTSGNVAGFEPIIDKISNKGPVAGICSSILEIEDFDQVLFCPVDLPLLKSETIKHLLLDRPELVRFEFEPMPFLLKLDEKTKIIAEKVLDELEFHDYSVKKFQSHFQIKEIATNESILQSLTNTNNPNEWAKINGGN